MLLLLWLVVLAVLPGGASASSGPGTVNGRIAFTSEGGSGRIARPEVWTMNQDGSDTRRLGPGSDPSWSLDGAQLALLDAPGGRGGIVLVRADGSDRRMVEITGLSGADRGIFTPALSPDGETIAFGTFVGLYVVPANGGEARRLASRAGNTEIPEFIARPSWSPDGRRIAFLGQGGRVSVVDADGSGLRALPGAYGAVGGRVSWSPDGSTIAYGSIVPGAYSGRRFRISTVRLDGAAPTVLVPFNGTSATDPTWSPDGTRIAFVSEKDICVANADGTRLGRLTYTRPLGLYPAKIHPAWQPLAAGSPPAGATTAPPGPPASWNRNRSWSTACKVQGYAGRTLTGRVDRVRARIGDVVEYRLRLANRGDVPIGDGIQASFWGYLDGGARVLSVVAGRGRCVASRAVYFGSHSADFECRFGSIFPGERIDVVTRARARAPGEIRLQVFHPYPPLGRPRRRLALVRRTRIDGCTIRGSERFDVLSGTPRDDVLCGLDGDDRIRPGAGSDRVYAGPDNDVVLVRDELPDHVSCGSGADLVRADRSDRVAADCERVDRG